MKSGIPALFYEHLPSAHKKSALPSKKLIELAVQGDLREIGEKGANVSTQKLPPDDVGTIWLTLWAEEGGTHREAVERQRG